MCYMQSMGTWGHVCLIDIIKRNCWTCPESNTIQIRRQKHAKRLWNHSKAHTTTPNREVKHKRQHLRLLEWRIESYTILPSFVTCYSHSSRQHVFIELWLCSKEYTMVLALTEHIFIMTTGSLLRDNSGGLVVSWPCEQSSLSMFLR